MRIPALLIAASLVLTGCGKPEKSALEPEPKKTAKVTLANEETKSSKQIPEEPAVEETTSSSAVETESAETESQAAFTPDPIADDNSFEIKVREFVAKNREEAPDVLYSLFTSFDNGVYQTLLVKDGNKTSRFCLSQGELLMTDEDYDIDTSCLLWLNADEITLLPFYVNLNKDSLIGMNLTEDPKFTQKVDDGSYYGKVLGFDEEGNKILLLIGTPFVMDDSAIAELQVGDPIGFSDFKVTGLSDAGVEVENIYRFDNSRTASGKSMLVTPNGHAVTSQNFLALLPVWGGCDVNDGLLKEALPDDYAAFENTEPGGSYILRSFFFYLKTRKEGLKLQDCWYQADGLVTPVTIYDGDVAAITFFE